MKKWYDGFSFGRKKDIYNPGSIINYLDTGKFDTYWANTSSNSLVTKLIQTGDAEVKADFEELLCGKSIYTTVDEEIVYDQLDESIEAVFSLLLTGGYLKIVNYELPSEENGGNPQYELALTNLEVRFMFCKMVRQ